MMNKKDIFSLRDALLPITDILARFGGGSFTFTNDVGEHFVIMRECDVHKKSVEKEKQLALPSPDTVAKAIRKNIEGSVDNEIIERVNRDIALDHLHEQEQQEELGEIVETEFEENVEFEDNVEFDVDDGNHIERGERPAPPPVRIKFEPIRGDISPDLQE